MRGACFQGETDDEAPVLTSGSPHPPRCRCGAALAEGVDACPMCGAPVAPRSESPTRVEPGAKRRSGSGVFHAPSAHSDGGWAPGTVLGGRYRLVGLLGRGGMGSVYRAEDLRLGQEVALKFLPAEVADDPSWVETLHGEVRTARLVTHPNACRVFDIGEVEGRTFLSMEYVDGEDLASLLTRIGRLPEAKAVELAHQLCAALTAAHERGVVHRDLKPANIMIDGQGRARITDFGLAILVGGGLREGEVVGTPLYMAPEQLAGGRPSTRSDLYALGLVLYELVTGRRPYAGGSPTELARSRAEPATPPSVHLSGLDPALERAIMVCLEPDPAARPASALHVARMLPRFDPLAEALAAGRTPAPELVAEAGPRGALTATIAWRLLAGLGASVALCVLLAPSTSLLGVAAPAKSPEVLTDRALGLIAAAGYETPPADLVGWFETAPAELHRGLSDRKAGGPGASPLARAVRFVLRTSPSPLVSFNPLRSISESNPPLTTPGMATLVLDGAGHLASLQGLAPESNAASGAAFDWSGLLTAAALEPSTCREVAPGLTPRVPFDERRAWRCRAVGAGEDDPSTRVEAASFQGRPVLLETGVDEPGAPSSAADRGPGRDLAGSAYVVVFLLCLGAGAVLARRNLRLGRGDARGALRLAALITALQLFRSAATAHLVFPSAMAFFAWFRTVAASAVWAGLMGWLFYLALEPAARRAWPRLLTSWSRIVAGRARDPMVGRDLLAGATIGAAASALHGVATAALPAVGLDLPPRGTTLSALLGVRQLLAAACGEVAWTLIGLVIVTAVMAAVARLSGSRRFAVAVAVLISFVSMLTRTDSWLPAVVGITTSLAISAVVIAVLARLGALAALTSLTVWLLLQRLPLDVSPGAWYAGSSWLAICLVAAIALLGFVGSLGGASAFGAGTPD